MQIKGLAISFIWYLTMKIINLDSLCILYIYPPVTVVVTDNVFLLSSFFYIYLFIYSNLFNFYFFIYQFVELGIVRCMFPLSPAFAHTWIENLNILKASLFSISISSFGFPFCNLFFFLPVFYFWMPKKLKEQIKCFCLLFNPCSVYMFYVYHELNTL